MDSLVRQNICGIGVVERPFVFIFKDRDLCDRDCGDLLMMFRNRELGGYRFELAMVFVSCSLKFQWL